MLDLQPLILYANGASPNPWKVIIILEELELSYTVEEVLFAEVKKEPFISLNPNGRVPALVDPNTDVKVWESGAIIDYLIDEYDKDAKLHYTTSPQKHVQRCWEHLQMSGQGPYFGQKMWFDRYHPEKVPSAQERYGKEIERVIGVVDSHLRKQGTDYLVGDKATYADLMFIPWFLGVRFACPDLDTTQWKDYTAWMARLASRPGTARALEKQAVAIAKFNPPPPK